MTPTSSWNVAVLVLTVTTVLSSPVHSWQLCLRAFLPVARIHVSAQAFPCTSAWPSCLPHGMVGSLCAYARSLLLPALFTPVLPIHTSARRRISTNRIMPFRHSFSMTKHHILRRTHAHTAPRLHAPRYTCCPYRRWRLFQPVTSPPFGCCSGASSL